MHLELFKLYTFGEQINIGAVNMGADLAHLT